jgi:TetR/AcrR family transcriptional regulator, mexJK operon transcriptional repressor
VSSVSQPARERRSDRKQREIMAAAASLFLKNGYDGTSMDDIATLAGVSKPTVYKHFSDKERLFAAIALATTEDVLQLVQVVTETFQRTEDIAGGLLTLAQRFLAELMRPDVLRLRRLIIANAERFPEVGQTWYQQGFGRVLIALANSFEKFAERGLLSVDDPTMAANHFVGLLLWVPVNEVMFTGRQSQSRRDVDRFAHAAVKAFLDGYRGALASFDGG